MKEKNYQEETYFLSKAQETRYTKSHIWGVLLIHKFECKPFRKSRSFGTAYTRIYELIEHPNNDYKQA